MPEGREAHHPLEVRIEEWKNKMQEQFKREDDEAEKAKGKDPLYLEMNRIRREHMTRSMDTAKALAAYEVVYKNSPLIEEIYEVVSNTRNQEVIKELINRLDPVKSIQYWYDRYTGQSGDFISGVELDSFIVSHRCFFEQMEAQLKGDVLEALKSKKEQFEDAVGKFNYNIEG